MSGSPPESHRHLTDAEVLGLKRWNTPSVYNGWEQVTRRDAAHEGFNLEVTTDFMPHLGSMVGYAVTVTCRPGSPEPRRNAPDAWSEYREHIASVPGPKIVVVQDLDKPATWGSFWGECNAGIHRALGCAGTITDGAIRDVEEMTQAGFKAIARCLCVGHAHVHPIEWNCPVEVFGRPVEPGRLIHADTHGFLVIPEEDEARLLEAVQFMDSNECRTIIPAARDTAGKSFGEIRAAIDDSVKAHGEATKHKFGKRGEW